MSELNWTVLKNINELMESNDDKSKYLGRVYLIEYGDLLKIGKSISIKSRLSLINSYAKKYSQTNTGRIAFTKLHTNYSKNETLLHKIFKEKRVSGELFKTSIEEVVLESDVLTFIDESIEMEKRSKEKVDNFMTVFKNMAPNNSQNTLTEEETIKNLTRITRKNIEKLNAEFKQNEEKAKYAEQIISHPRYDFIVNLAINLKIDKFIFMNMLLRENIVSIVNEELLLNKNYVINGMIENIRVIGEFNYNKPRFTESGISWIINKFLNAGKLEVV